MPDTPTPERLIAALEAGRAAAARDRAMRPAIPMGDHIAAAVKAGYPEDTEERGLWVHGYTEGAPANGE